MFDWLDFQVNKILIGSFEFNRKPVKTLLRGYDEVRDINIRRAARQGGVKVLSIILRQEITITCREKRSKNVFVLVCLCEGFVPILFRIRL